MLISHGQVEMTGRPGHEAFILDQAASAAVVVIHGQKRVGAGAKPHSVHTLVHNAQLTAVRHGRKGRRNSLYLAFFITQVGFKTVQNHLAEREMSSYRLSRRREASEMSTSSFISFTLNNYNNL